MLRVTINLVVFIHIQSAAGTFSYLLSSAIPKLIFPPDVGEIPLDLSESFLKSLERLMLAQAQECSWQMAKLSKDFRHHTLTFVTLVTDNYKNGVVARVAAQVRTPVICSQEPGR